MIGPYDPVTIATLRVLNVSRHEELDEGNGTYPVEQMLIHELWWALEERLGVDLHDVLNGLEDAGTEGLRR